MTPEEAIEMLRGMQNKKVDYAELVCAPAFASGYTYVYPEPEDYAIEEAISALKEIQQYRKIGTVEEFRKSVREDEILKFYYCESEDDYYIGKRIGNFYYARYGETGFEWFMSRYLPWGEHVVSPHTLWKEYTYPSKPKEIPFFEWLQGFLKKYCGGTVEECREAKERQTPKRPVWKKGRSVICKDYADGHGEVEENKWADWVCPNCGWFVGEQYIPRRRNQQKSNYCSRCGQAIQWDKNLKGMEDEL